MIFYTSQIRWGGLNQIYRQKWADYFDSQGIQYAFFSAANAAAIQQARRDALTAQEAARDAAAKAEEDSSEGDSEAEGLPEPESHTATPPPESADPSSSSEEELSSADESDETDEARHFTYSAEDESEEAKDSRTRVLSVLELEDLFLRAAPDLSGI